MQWSVRGLGQGDSKIFNFYGLKLEIDQTRKIGPILQILTEFDRFYSVLISNIFIVF